MTLLINLREEEARGAAKSSNPLWLRCYICHHINSFICFSALLLSSLGLFLQWAEAGILNQREITLVLVSCTGRQRMSVSDCLHTEPCENVMKLPNKRRPEVAWHREELLWTELNLLYVNKRVPFVELKERRPPGSNGICLSMHWVSGM